MFEPVSGNVSFPKQEEEVLAFWRERDIYAKSLARREGSGKKFVFFEGPPTANGMPHPGHCLTRAIKDLFPRYRTMRGYYCRRKAGWDTHGLPVEVEVCKELGIHSKEEIEAYGIEPFIQKCQQSVWRYMQEWEKLTERIGFWIRLDEAYVTYHQSYVESVWWSLKELFLRKLLYQDDKIVWWWAQGGTALSTGEVGQGYRLVDDPSVFVKFPLLDQDGKPTDTSLLIWTTTPWTLPSNQFVAIGERLDYIVVRDTNGERLIIAAKLKETLEAKFKQQFEVEQILSGGSLIGRRYKPPFDYFYRENGTRTSPLYRPKEGERWADYPLLYASNTLNLDSSAQQKWLQTPRHLGWHIFPAKFVSTDSGTGLVHIAPAFGADDFDLLKQEKQLFGPTRELPALLCPVDPAGKFTEPVTGYKGRWVKECDKDIIRELKADGYLYHQESIKHEYPFCWRAEEDPLIQYPRKSWFVATSQYKRHMLANSNEINWLPDHIKQGRFGNFLETNVDWALSRERFWGTPLPIWVCNKTGQREAVDSYDELLKKPGIQGAEVWEAAKKENPQLPDDLRVHKPYIDAITYSSPFEGGGRMERVPDVIDCWYDSGAMPFAQWGYRGEKADSIAAGKLHDQFPADFISEAIDQTRGWFYSQLAISTLLFGRRPLTAEETLALPADERAAHIDDIVSGLENPSAGLQNVAKFSVPHGSDEAMLAEYPHPFKNCIVLGLMLAEWWECANSKTVYLSEADAKAACGDKYVKKTGKMSKQKRNYREPRQIFDTYGADALRWYFFANQPPWSSILYAERAIKDSIPEFLLRLWNCYSFFANYAGIDGFDPAKTLSGKVEQLSADELKQAQGYRPVQQRGEIDRWVLSELNRTAAAIVERMDAYDNYAACQKLNEFVDALSNWYIRRCRDRFWSDETDSPDKLDAHWTLYECLLTTTKLIAPFTPFLAETLWQKLAVKPFGGRVLESVHLCDYPAGDATVVDALLSDQMALLRDIASLGRAARMEAKLKVRQPLAKVEVVLAATTHQKWLESHDELLRDELNVKAVHYATEGKEYISYQVQPNFKALGPLVGPLLPEIKKLLGAADGGALLTELKDRGTITLRAGGKPVELTSEHVQVRLSAKPGWAAAQGKGCVVVLNTEVTPELVREGIARDFIRAVQDRRKEINCNYTDRIEVGVVTEAKDLREAAEANLDMIKEATLARKIAFAALAGVEGKDVEVADAAATLFVKVENGK